MDAAWQRRAFLVYAAVVLVLTSAALIGLPAPWQGLGAIAVYLVITLGALAFNARRFGLGAISSSVLNLLILWLAGVLLYLAGRRFGLQLLAGAWSGLANGLIIAISARVLYPPPPRRN